MEEVKKKERGGEGKAYVTREDVERVKSLMSVQRGGEHLDEEQVVLQAVMAIVTGEERYLDAVSDEVHFLGYAWDERKCYPEHVLQVPTPMASVILAKHGLNEFVGTSVVPNCSATYLFVPKEYVSGEARKKVYKWLEKGREREYQKRKAEWEKRRMKSMGLSEIE